jgi:hypothetical protein
MEGESDFIDGEAGGKCGVLVTSDRFSDRDDGVSADVSTI